MKNKSNWLLLLVLIFVLSSFSAYANCGDPKTVEKCVADNPEKLGDSQYVNDPQLQKAVDEYVKNNKQLITPAFAKARMGITLDPKAPIARYNPPRLVTAKTDFDFTKYQGGKVLPNGRLEHGSISHSGILGEKEGFTTVKGGDVALAEGADPSVLANKKYEVLSGMVSVKGKGAVLSSKDHGAVRVAFNSEGEFTASNDPKTKALFVPEKGIVDGKKPIVHFTGTIAVAPGQVGVGSNTIAGLIGPVKGSDKKAGFAVATEDRPIFISVDNSECTNCVRYDSEKGSVTATGLVGGRILPRGLASITVEQIPEGSTFKIFAKGDTASKVGKVVIGDVGKGTVEVYYTDKNGVTDKQIFSGNKHEIQRIKTFPPGFSIEVLKKDGVSLSLSSINPQNPFATLIKSLATSDKKLPSSDLGVLKPSGGKEKANEIMRELMKTKQSGKTPKLNEFLRKAGIQIQGDTFNKESIRAFQVANDLKPDGVLGFETMSKLTEKVTGSKPLRHEWMDTRARGMNVARTYGIKLNPAMKGIFRKTDSYKWRYNAPKGTGKRSRPHYGTDIACKKGMKCSAFSPYSGIVVSANKRCTYNCNIVMRGRMKGNDGRMHTVDVTFRHMSKVSVSRRQKITPSTKIGNIGFYGTGVHLHKEVKIDGRLTDPCLVGACMSRANRNFAER